MFQLSFSKKMGLMDYGFGNKVPVHGSAVRLPIIAAEKQRITEIKYFSMIPNG